MMSVDFEKEMLNAMRDALREGVKAKFTGYSSPMDAVIKSAFDSHAGEFRELLDDSIRSCLSSEQFREEIAAATRKTLAKLLVQRFGGEIEKQINVLKSDPVTRAKIVAAIDEIVSTK